MLKMMTKDEALKMAIKELSQTALGDTPALKACREALEQEPLNLNCKSVQKRLATQWGYIEQPAQDFFERGKEIAKWADKQNEQPAQEPYKFIHPYYGNLTEMLPTKKEPIAPSWQGLSDGDVMKIVWDLEHITDKDLFVVEFYRAIEAKLKEKNHD